MASGATTATVLGMSPMVASTVVLAATYAVVISEKINRSIVALVGACVMVVAGLLTQDEAIKGIDFNTIGLVSISRRSGMFQYVAVRAAQIARAHPGRVLLLLQIATAVLSALLDNVTTVLLIVPVTLAIVRELDVPVYPFLFAEIMASNIGGTATLVGDPPNILIGSLAGIDFNAFLIHLAPLVVVLLVVQTLMIHVLWGRSLKSTPEHEARIMAMRAVDKIEDWTLLKQSLFILCGVILGFVVAHPLHLEPATIAMFGAAVLMLLDNWQHHNEKAAENIHSTFSDVEWITIFFFVGLFIVVKGVEANGLLSLAAAKLTEATGGSLPKTGFAILWASAILSAIVDNIPFVATMIPLIKNMAPAFGGPDAIQPLWWALSLGACLGGNGTLIGASANLTVAGIAERGGVPFSFVKYSLYAFPMMLVSVAISHVYIWWRYF